MTVIRGIVISGLIKIFPRLVEQVSSLWVLKILLVVIIPGTVVVKLVLWERAVLHWSILSKVLIIIALWWKLIGVTPVVVHVYLEIAL